MAKIYLSVNGDKVGSKISESIMSNDPEQVREASAKFNEAHAAIDRWVESTGGRIISASGDEGVYEIEDSKLNEIEDIIQNYQNKTGHTLSAGVGSDMLESVKAMIYGKMHDPGQIIEYDSEVESAITPQEESEAEEMVGEDSEMEPSEEDEESESEFDTGEDDAAQPMEDEEFNEESEMEDESPMTTGEEELEEGEDPSEEMEEESDEDEESVTIPKDEFVDEHEDLIDTLESPEHEDDLEEAEDQQAELDEVEGGESDELSGDSGELEKEDDLEAEPEMDEDMEDEESELPDMSEDDLTSPEDEDMEDEDMEDEDMEDEESPILDMVHANAEESEMEEDESEESPEDMMTPDQAMPMEEEMTDEEDESSEDDSQLKQRVIDTLMNFKQNKDKIQAMQQTDPQTYQSVMDMINSMIEMAKELSIDPEQGVAAQEGLSGIPEESDMADVNKLDIGEVDPKKTLGGV